MNAGVCNTGRKATHLLTGSLLGPNPIESDLAVQNWVPSMSVSIKHPDDAIACGSWNTVVEKQVETCLLNKYKRSPHSCSESLP